MDTREQIEAMAALGTPMMQALAMPAAERMAFLAAYAPPVVAPEPEPPEPKETP
jgi:hypothetical protein